MRMKSEEDGGGGVVEEFCVGTVCMDGWMCSVLCAVFFFNWKFLKRGKVK